MQRNSRPSGLTIADCDWAFGLWLAVSEARQNCVPSDSLMQKMFSFAAMSIFTLYVVVTRQPVILRAHVERLIQSLKEECLYGFVIVAERQPELCLLGMAAVFQR